MTIILLASSEWVIWLSFHLPLPPPIIVVALTILALAVTIYGIFIIIKLLKQVDNLKLGRDGERIVAENIQDLLKEGAVVLHDILGDKFNVDHVVISNHGIFTLETKTISKPMHPEATISVKNDCVFANGYEVGRNPIQQAKTLSSWIQDLLYKSTGKKFPVKPVVLFPGWFVEPLHGGEEV